MYKCTQAHHTHMVVLGKLIGVSSCLPPESLRDLTQVIRIKGQDQMRFLVIQDKVFLPSLAALKLTL